MKTKYETVTIRGIPHVAQLTLVNEGRYEFYKLLELKRVEVGQPIKIVWRISNV